MVFDVGTGGKRFVTDINVLLNHIRAKDVDQRIRMRSWRDIGNIEGLHVAGVVEDGDQLWGERGKLVLRQLQHRQLRHLGDIFFAQDF